MVGKGWRAAKDEILTSVASRLCCIAHLPQTVVVHRREVRFKSTVCCKSCNVVVNGLSVKTGPIGPTVPALLINTT